MAEDVPFDIEKSTYCTFCEEISFHKLPHEQDPGIPHQPSFAALKSSARSCLLCYLLLKGINDTRASLRSPSLDRMCLFIARGNESFSTQAILGACAPGGVSARASHSLEKVGEQSN